MYKTCIRSVIAQDQNYTLLSQMETINQTRFLFFVWNSNKFLIVFIDMSYRRSNDSHSQKYL